MTDDAGSDEVSLLVELAGEQHRADREETLTFGRAGDIVVDDANPYLHRIAGRFSWHDGWWWVENLGRQIELELVGIDGTLVRLPALHDDRGNVAAPLTARAYVVRFEAGGHRYELEVEPGAGLRLPLVPADDLAGETTTRYGFVALTSDERQLLAALSEPCLRNPTVGPESLPTNRAVAHRLGWSITKFNRKLDYLCTRLTRSGVRGLQGGRGEEATNRRWRLVEHAIAVRLVTPDDVDALP